MTRTSPPRSAQHVRSSAEIPDPVTNELRRYDDHLRDVRGLAAGTRRNNCQIVDQLLRKKFAGGAVAMATLRPVDVRRFIARQLGDSPSHSAAAQVATSLRSYLRYWLPTTSPTVAETRPTVRRAAGKSMLFSMRLLHMGIGRASLRNANLETSMPVLANPKNQFHYRLVTGAFLP